MRMASNETTASPGVDNRRRSNSTASNKKEVSRFRRWLVAPAGLFLIWAPLTLLVVYAVVTRSFAAYFAEFQPETALQLRSTETTALLNLAGKQLKREQAGLSSSAPARLDREAVTEIRSWAELALRNDPLHARAFSILGQLSQRDADEKRTETLMQAAVRRSIHESIAVYWLMQKSYEDQDYHAAVRYADTLLRTRQDRSGLTGPVVSVLAKIAELEGPGGDVEQLLARNPPWRSRFFGHLSGAISDARTPLNIFLALQDTPDRKSTRLN